MHARRDDIRRAALQDELPDRRHEARTDLLVHQVVELLQRVQHDDHAARLIESCGLKGCAIGAARVSEKHANFIVNPGGRASAADIEALIGHVRSVVRERTDVDLVPEIQIIGDAT